MTAQPFSFLFLLAGLSVATCKKLINNVETDGAGDLLGQRTQELIGAMGTG